VERDPTSNVNVRRTDASALHIDVLLRTAELQEHPLAGEIGAIRVIVRDKRVYRLFMRGVTRLPLAEKSLIPARLAEPQRHPGGARRQLLSYKLQLCRWLPTARTTTL
jgi:hypothetical protein